MCVGDYAYKYIILQIFCYQAVTNESCKQIKIQLLAKTVFYKLKNKKLGFVFWVFFRLGNVIWEFLFLFLKQDLEAALASV